MPKVLLKFAPLLLPPLLVLLGAAIDFLVILFEPGELVLHDLQILVESLFLQFQLPQQLGLALEFKFQLPGFPQLFYIAILF